jgi:hypothetical protein
MICAAFGSPRVLVSCCKTNSRSAVTAEVAGSSPVVPTTRLVGDYAMELPSEGRNYDFGSAGVQN